MLEISIEMIEFDDLILIEIEVDMQRTWIIYSPPTRERKREKERVSMKSKKLERCFQEFRREYFRRSMNLQPLFNGVHP